MKRLIKYSSSYNDLRFSNCSTKYEVLPFVVEDVAGTKELRELADFLEFTRIGNVKTLDADATSYGRLKKQTITHTVLIDRESQITHYGATKTPKDIRLGFITILDDTKLNIKLNIGCDGILTCEDANELINYQNIDVRDVIELDDTINVVLESWAAYHHLEFLGYSFKQFCEVLNATDTIFDDSVFHCGKCGKWDYNENGYTYNYRIYDCEMLGVDCGCVNEYLKDNYQNRINDTDTPLELGAAEELEGETKIKHLERFIGGMTDGRGGWFAGKSCREGDPSTILTEYQDKYPTKDFVFSHDESGQFQTYFSIWQVIGDET